MDSDTDPENGSLKTIVINFLAFTVIVTVALIISVFYGKFDANPHGSVVTDSNECSNIGINILKRGGNALDAAIASTVCSGVIDFHLTGLGGFVYVFFS